MVIPETTKEALSFAHKALQKLKKAGIDKKGTTGISKVQSG